MARSSPVRYTGTAQREGALCLRIEASLRQQGGEVHLSLLLRVEDQLHVLGGLLGRHLLHRVVEPTELAVMPMASRSMRQITVMER